MRHFFHLLILFLLIACGPPEKNTTSNIPDGVKDHLHLVKPNKELLKADELKWQRRYGSAIKVYESLLIDSVLSQDESVHVWNQMIYCRSLVGGQMIRVGEELLAFEREMQTDSLSGIFRADYLFNKSYWLIYSGKGRSAIDYLSEAFQLYEQFYKGSHVRKIETSVLMSEATYYYSLNPTVLEGTFSYLDQAASILNQGTQLDPYVHRYYYWNAFVAFMKRQYEEGIVSVDIALDIMAGNPEISDLVLKGKCMLSKGTLLREMGEMRKAEEYIKAAINLGESSEELFGDQLQYFYKEILIHYMGDNDSLQYSYWINKTIDKFPVRKFVQPLRLDALWSFKQGDLIKSIGRYRKLIDSLDDRAIAYNVSKLYDEAYFLLADMYKQRMMIDSSVFFTMKSISLGTELYTKANITWEDILRPKIIGKSVHSFIDYSTLADTYFLKYEKEGGFEYLKKAEYLYVIADSLMFNYSLMADNSASLNFLSEVAANYYPNAVRVFYELFEKTKQTSYIDKANFFIERQKAFLLYRDAFSMSLPEVKNDSLTNFIYKEEKKIRAEVKKLKWLRAKNENVNQVNVQIHQLGQEIITLYKTYQQNHPLFFAQKMQHEIQPVSKIQALIKEEETVLQYSIGYKKIHLIKIKKDEVEFLQWAKPDSLDVLYERFREVLQSSDASLNIALFNEYQSEAYQLYQCFFEPAGLISKKVLIVPDASYPHVPFGAFVQKEPEGLTKLDYSRLDYLEKKYILSYTPSLKTYSYHNQQEKKRLSNKSKLLCFAYSELSDGSKNSHYFRSAELSELRGAAREVKYISDLFSNENNRFYYGPESNRDQFFKEIRKEYDIVHLALHAEADINAPLNSRLFFRDSKSKKRTSPVYSYEISTLNLSNSLVVLSACSTDEGKIYDADGTHSLTHAFMEAGAGEVVSASWKVSDYSTSKIMEKFYDSIKSGDGVEIALHHAKTQYLYEADQYLSFPGYWAGMLHWK